MTTETVTAQQFRILPFPAGVLRSARSGAVPGQEWVASGGEPVRCCLRDAQPGDLLTLFNFRPELPGSDISDSPYQEQGAVFIHAERCPGPADLTTYPVDWLTRPQIFRAYDERGWIHPASRTHDGTDSPRALGELLATPGVAAVHSRNIVYGCFMFAAAASAI